MSKHLIVGMVALAIGTSGLVGGCRRVKIRRKDSINVVEENYDAVDVMLKASREDLPKGCKILTATFVDLDDVTNASPLGRLLGETASARLTQRGHTVVNMKIRRDSVAINADGEFLLSRDARQLSADYDAKAVLVGTYRRTNAGARIRSLSKELEDLDAYSEEALRNKRIFEVVEDYVYVSLRLVWVEDNTVVGAYDYRILCDEGVMSLLSGYRP